VRRVLLSFLSITTLFCIHCGDGIIEGRYELTQDSTPQGCPGEVHSFLKAITSYYYYFWEGTGIIDVTRINKNSIDIASEDFAYSWTATNSEGNEETYTITDTRSGEISDCGIAEYLTLSLADVGRNVRLTFSDKVSILWLGPDCFFSEPINCVITFESTGTPITESINSGLFGQ